MVKAAAFFFPADSFSIVAFRSIASLAAFSLFVSRFVAVAGAFTARPGVAAAGALKGAAAGAEAEGGEEAAAGQGAAVAVETADARAEPAAAEGADDKGEIIAGFRVVLAES